MDLYVHDKKKKELQDRLSKKLKININPKIFNVKNGIIYPLVHDSEFLFGRGGVKDSNYQFIKESGIPFRIGEPQKNDFSKISNEKIIYCGYLVDAWGHFIVEGITRLWYLISENYHYKCAFIIREKENIRTIEGNYKDFFRLLGILNRVILINEATKFEEVVIPERGYKKEEEYSPKFLELIKYIQNKAIKENQGPFFNKIYLSQYLIGKNKSIGLEILDDYYKKNGFEIVYPEKESLSRLIYLMNKADIIAVTNGSLHHNLLFAKDNQDIEIIEKHGYINEFSVDFNIIKKFKYKYIDAFYEPYPIQVGQGPFFIAFSKYLKKFTRDFCRIEPNILFTSDKYIFNCFVKYLKQYKKDYWITLDDNHEFIFCNSEKYLFDIFFEDGAYLKSLYFKNKRKNKIKLLFNLYR